MKAHLVSVAADGGDALDPEIKRCDWETCLLEEGHDEAAQAAVDMEANLVLRGELAQTDDVILASIWEIDGRSYDLHIPAGELSIRMTRGVRETHHDGVRVADRSCDVSFPWCAC